MAVLPHLRKSLQDLRKDTGLGLIVVGLVCVCFLLFILAGCVWLWWVIIKGIWSLAVFCFDHLAAFANANPTTFGAFLLLLIAGTAAVSLAIWLITSTTKAEQSNDLSLDSCQKRVWVWLNKCFGFKTAVSREARNARFLEEALELVQSLGLSKEGAHQMVEYVYSRPIGDPPQEVAGSIVTLLALAESHDISVYKELVTEILRIEGKIEVIRAKQLTKPTIV